MKATFSYRGTFRPNAKTDIEREIYHSLEVFFKRYKETLEIHITVFRVAPSSVGQSRIKVIPLHPDFGIKPTGIPVSIYTTGTQGAFCLMIVSGKNDEQVRQLIANGPYVRKAQEPCSGNSEQPPPCQNSVVDEGAAEATSEEPPSPPPQQPLRTKHFEPIRIADLRNSPELLGVFYLELAETHFGGKKEGFVIIPKTFITDQAARTFGIADTATMGSFFGNYLSKVGERFVARDKTGCWKFDVEKVLAFTGLKSDPLPNVQSLPEGDASSDVVDQVVELPIIETDQDGVSSETVHQEVTQVTDSDSEVEEEVPEEVNPEAQVTQNDTVMSLFEQLAPLQQKAEARTLAEAELQALNKRRVSLNGEISSLNDLLDQAVNELSNVLDKIAKKEEEVAQSSLSEQEVESLKIAREQINKLLG